MTQGAVAVDAVATQPPKGAIHIGDCLESLRRMGDGTVDCCVTSPPYFNMRDYCMDGQIGAERSVGEYVAKLVEVFREVRRTLVDDGTLWLNLGDKTDPKSKQLLGVPWNVAFAMQADGWILRQDIIWHKPNAMPMPAKDRCVYSHEYVFLFAKSKKYHFDHRAIQTEIKEPVVNGKPRVFGGANKHSGYGTRSHSGRVYTPPKAANKRSVWSYSTSPFSGSHFATFPPSLIEPMVSAGCPPGGIVLDPFLGSGTTAVVAESLGRRWIGCELNESYVQLAIDRIRNARLPK